MQSGEEGRQLHVDEEGESGFEKFQTDMSDLDSSIEMIGISMTRLNHLLDSKGSPGRFGSSGSVQGRHSSRRHVRPYVGQKEEEGRQSGGLESRLDESSEEKGGAGEVWEGEPMPSREEGPQVQVGGEESRMKRLGVESAARKSFLGSTKQGEFSPSDEDRVRKMRGGRGTDRIEARTRELEDRLRDDLRGRQQHKLEGIGAGISVLASKLEATSRKVEQYGLEISARRSPARDVSPLFERGSSASRMRSPIKKEGESSSAKRGLIYVDESTIDGGSDGVSISSGEGGSFLEDEGSFHTGGGRNSTRARVGTSLVSRQSIGEGTMEAETSSLNEKPRPFASSLMGSTSPIPPSASVRRKGRSGQSGHTFKSPGLGKEGSGVTVRSTGRARRRHYF